MNLSNTRTNQLIDGLYRGGAVNSTAVCNKGARAANTAYAKGDRTYPNAVDTGAGGKFLVCTTAGTSQATLAALAIGAPGTTVTDGGVTWTVVSGIPSDLAHYIGLLVINKGLRTNNQVLVVGDCVSLTPQGGAGGDTNQHLYRCTTAGTTAAAQPQYNGVDGEVITDGSAVLTELSPVLKTGTGFPAGLSEVTGGAYARVKVEAGAYPALTDWAATQGGSTASTGTTAETSNSNAITFPQSAAAWTTDPARIGALVMYSDLTAGEYQGFGVLPTPQAVGASGITPSFAGGQLTIQQDN